MWTAITRLTSGSARAGASRLFLGLIWGFCLLLVAGTWWFVYQQTRFEHRQAIEDATRQNANRAIAFEQYVRRTIEAADLVTRYVGGRFARGDPGAEFAGRPGSPARISGTVARGGTFLGVTVIDPEGNIVATSIDRQLPAFNVAGHPAFRGHLDPADDGRLQVSRPVFSALAGQNVIWLTRRLNRPDGSFAGVIAINILPEQFTAFYRDAQVGAGDVMTVIGLDGIIRARRTDGRTTSGQNVARQPLMLRQLRAPNGTNLAPGAFDGRPRYSSHRRLRDYALFVTYGVLEAEVLAPARHRARIFVAAGALLSLVLIAFAVMLSLLLIRRGRREAELARANERLMEAQRIGQIGDWDFDLRSGAVYWSPQLCAQFERTPEQGSPSFEEFLAYLNDEGRAAIQRAHADAIRTGETQEIEYEVRLPSGVESRHQGVVIPNVDAAGNVIRLHGTDQNITARKMLDLLQTHVAHLSRVEAMNAMAATLAHELNQPLTAASNYLVGSRRLLNGGTAEEVEQGMIAAEHQVHLAANIIRRVREMVANQPKAVTSVSLSRVIEDALALLSVASLLPKIALCTELAADARYVKADRIQVQQVMVNLLRNACDATRGRADPRILISSRRTDTGMVEVSVADNGAGFAQPAGDRFSPFASTRNSGLGLGLSISRTIIEAHGGRIWIEDGDSESEGARVSFTLPAFRQGERNGRPEAVQGA